MGDMPKFLDRYQLDRPRSDRPLGFAAALADHHVPGISIALLEHGAVTQTWTMGRRSVTGGAPVEPDTLFQAGSISKSIAAACALRLVDEGVIDLDTDVNELLKSWQMPANDGWQPHVTLRQLLAHTRRYHRARPGRLPAGDAGAVGARHPRRQGKLGTGAGHRGARGAHSYSGGGYTIAQLVLTDVTGLDFDTLAWELVFEPAGMAHSTFAQPLDRARAANAAAGHRPGPAPVLGGWHTYPDLAAAGLWSTATDLARFFAAIRASAAGAPGALLSERSARAMLTRGAPNRAYGLGVELAEPGDRVLVLHQDLVPDDDVEATRVAP
jgi:CubicO group peptidase (beta-lactamase class C family)